MKFLTKELIAKIPKMYETEEIELADKVLQAKFFTPWTNWTWYVIEFDGEDRCFGLVEGFEREFGYFSIRELEAITGPYGLRVERDRYFKPCKYSELKD